MSMSLYVWRRPLVADPAEAARLLEVGEGGFEPSAELVRFYAELLELFPSPDALTDEELAAADIPWADPPEGSNRLVALSIRWSAQEDHLDAIVELAHAHGLVVYDPQGPSFHSPIAEGEDTPYQPGLGEFVRATLLAAAGIVVAVLAWYASVPVVSWIVLVASGFFALVAVLALGAVGAQAWRVRAGRGR